jgi:hypothetical protein
MNQHRLIMCSSVIKDDYENYNSYAEDRAHLYQLMYQLTRITRDKGALSKDDRIDALAMAVANWVDIMDQDVTKLEQDHQAALLQQELEKFIASATGQKPYTEGIDEFFGNASMAGMEVGL